MDLNHIQTQRNLNSELRSAIQSLRVIEGTLCDAVQTATGSDPCEDFGLPAHKNIDEPQQHPCSGLGWAGGGGNSSNGAGGGGESDCDSEGDSFNNISCIKETIELQKVLANQIATTSLLTTLISETVDRMFEPMDAIDPNKPAAPIPTASFGIPADFEAQLERNLKRRRTKD